MLTDAQCRNAVCPADKRRARFADAGGLYLEVSPAGYKRWFLKHRIGLVEKQLALGSHPNVTLSAARKARDRDLDDRRYCPECTHYRHGRCTKKQAVLDVPFKCDWFNFGK